MTFSAILFYILAAIVLYGAVRTVTAKNPVHAALHLVLTFCVSAMIWMLMQAEFLGVTLVVVYVGAVMVLFLFVVMMLDINIDRMREGFWGYLPIASSIGALIVLAGELIYQLSQFVARVGGVGEAFRLLSDLASGITGEITYVDGGYSINALSGTGA